MDAGEEGGGFDTQEFGGPACAVDFPIGVLKGRFDIPFFSQAYVIVGQDHTGIVSIFIDGPPKSFHGISKVFCLGGFPTWGGRLPPGPMGGRSYHLVVLV